MADLKISQLNALPGASLAAADELAVVDTSASETKKIVPADLVQYGYGLLSAGTLDGDKIEAGTTSARGTIQLTDSTASTSTTTAATPNAVKSAYDLANAALPVAGGTVSGNLVVSGDFTVNGTTTTIDTTTLVVEDKNIEIGVVGTPTDVTADGGGITLKGTTDKTINWIDSTDSWTSSENIDLAAGKDYKIAGTKVIDATSLGSAVVSSSLTSVGTIATGTWNGTTIATGYGGTGQSSYTDGELLIGKTDGTLAKSTLTAGTGVTITNSDGGITISASGSGGTVTSVTATSPIASTGGTTPVISIQDASTTQKGAVQLYDGFDSTSTTTAATANAAFILSGAIIDVGDIAEAALPKAGGTMTGSITFVGGQTFPGTLVSGDIGVTVQGYDADTAKTDVAQTYTAAQRGEITALTSAATITPDFADSNNFSVTLDTNATLANPSNLTAGQSGCIWITQSTGSHTLAYGSYWDFSGGTAPTLTTTASAVDCLVYAVQSSTKITATLITNLS